VKIDSKTPDVNGLMDYLIFPKEFLWGTATAAHQVEGNNSNSDWWHWEKRRKTVPNSNLACDHYHLYKEDFGLAKEILHNNAHRLSVEWARIEPKEGCFNEKELLHYKKVLGELKRLGLKTMVTLHHFTNPLWFARKDGWEKKENLKYFERYVSFCTKEFGNLVDYWIVINEPNVYTTMSYIRGFWPPEKKNLFIALKVFLNLASAHERAYQIIHRANPASQVASSINMTYFKTEPFFEKSIIKIIEIIANYSFILLSPQSWDFIGINYYFLHQFDLNKISLIKKIKRTDFLKLIEGERDDLGRPVYPQGIYEIVKKAWSRFKIPIIITENGIADEKDSKRSRFIVDHLTWLNQAIKEGVDVRGYFYWSLMDNIEWSLGKKAKFGLFETDYKTLKRIPRKSAFLYGKICQNNTTSST
jgi:beta-glucosidase